MAQSKTTRIEYKDVSFTLSRNDQDVGDKWTAENNDWFIGPFATKKETVELAHFAIDYMGDAP